MYYHHAFVYYSTKTLFSEKYSSNFNECSTIPPANNITSFIFK